MGRVEQAERVYTRLMEYRTRMRKGQESCVPMVGAHATRSHSASKLSWHSASVSR